MQIALYHGHYDPKHLSHVKEKMREMGAPTIRCIYIECHDIYAALEGCHRLRAAHALGITPEIELINCCDDILDIPVRDVLGLTGEDYDNYGEDVIISDVIYSVPSAFILDFEKGK